MDKAVEALQLLEGLPDKIKSIAHREWVLNDHRLKAGGFLWRLKVAIQAKAC